MANNINIIRERIKIMKNADMRIVVDAHRTNTNQIVLDIIDRNRPKAFIQLDKKLANDVINILRKWKKDTETRNIERVWTTGNITIKKHEDVERFGVDVTMNGEIVSVMFFDDLMLEAPNGVNQHYRREVP